MVNSILQRRGFTDDGMDGMLTFQTYVVDFGEELEILFSEGDFELLLYLHNVLRYLKL